MLFKVLQNSILQLLSPAVAGYVTGSAVCPDDARAVYWPWGFKLLVQLSGVCSAGPVVAYFSAAVVHML